MKQIDPLIGYQVTQGHPFQQIGLFIALSYLIIIDELHWKDVDNAIAIQFISHCISVFIQLANMVLVRCTKLQKSRVFTYTAVVFTSLLYYGCIIYCQVMFLRNYDQITDKHLCGEEAAINWMTLEVMFFYANILFTIVYLFLHQTFGLKISRDNAIFEEQPQSDEFVDPFERELTFQDRTERQDFLMATAPFLQTFTLFSTFFGVAIASIAYDSIWKNASETLYTPMLFLIVSTSISFLTTTINQFGPFPVRGLLEVVLTILAVLGTLISLCFILFRTGDLSVDSPSMIRYYALTLFSSFSIIVGLLVVVAGLFYGIMWLIKRSGRSLAIPDNQQPNADDNNQQRQNNCSITFEDNREPFEQKSLNMLKFSEDYYTISYLTYYCLFNYQFQYSPGNLIQESFLRRFNTTLQQNNRQPNQQRQQTEMEQAIASTQTRLHATDAIKHMSSCMFIWIIQMSLVFLVFMQFTKDSFQVTTSSFSVLFSRVLCAILLHMQLSGEISQSIKMFNFARCHVNKTSYSVSMMAISLMQFSGALATETINILLICAQDDVQDVLMNYIALGVIAEIDDYYASTQTNDPVKEIIDKVEFPISEDQLRSERTSSEWWMVSTWIYKVFMKTFYQCYYFYFMPLTVIIVSYFWQVSSS